MSVKALCWESSVDGWIDHSSFFSKVHVPNPSMRDLPAPERFSGEQIKDQQSLKLRETLDIQSFPTNKTEMAYELANGQKVGALRQYAWLSYASRESTWPHIEYLTATLEKEGCTTRGVIISSGSIGLTALTKLSTTTIVHERFWTNDTTWELSFFLWTARCSSPPCTSWHPYSW